MDSISDSEYFRNIPESFPPGRVLDSGKYGYAGKCCGYIYYVKLVTNAAASKYPHWGYENKGVWPKGEYGKVIREGNFPC